jgi:hypothetical protein
MVGPFGLVGGWLEEAGGARGMGWQGGGGKRSGERGRGRGAGSKHGQGISRRSWTWGGRQGQGQALTGEMGDRIGDGMGRG